MRLEVPRDDRWFTFYSRYCDVDEPNDAGWSNFPCVLPTHGNGDTGKHGSINVYSGNYRCWNEDCVTHYNQAANKRSSSKTLTPREFLTLIGHTPDDAARVVSEFLKYNTPAPVDNNAFIKEFPGKLPGLDGWLRDAQERLTPDLPIVVEYTTSRGLTFETLLRAGTGYVPEDNNQDECLVLPYYCDGRVVGVRGRTIDGRKGAIKNSWFTLFGLQALDELETRVATIVEGETDCLVLKQLVKMHDLDIAIFGTPGARFAREWSRHLQDYDDIIVVPQDDQASQALVQDLRGTLASKLHILNLPWKPKQWGKDVADFILQSGSEYLVEELRGRCSAPRKRIYTVVELVEKGREAIPWIVPELIERGTKTLIVGKPKTYKTWLALQMMRSVIGRTPYLGVEEWTPTDEGLSAMLIEEEGSIVRLGQRAAKALYNIPQERAWFLHRQRIRLDDADSLSQLREDVKLLSPDLILFDPYVELHTQDENDVAGVRVIIDAMNELQQTRPDCSIIIFHHTPKVGEGPRGSGALYGAVDTMIEVKRISRNSISLDITGRDFVALDGPLTFEFDGALGLHRPTEDIRVEPASDATTTRMPLPSSREILAAFDEESPESLILGHLYRAMTPKSVVELQALTGLSAATVSRIADVLVERGVLTRTGEGRKGSPVRYQTASIAD